MKKTKTIFLLILLTFSLSACSSALDKAIENGEKSFENHEYDEALSYFQEAVDLGSGNYIAEDAIVLIEAYNKASKLFKKEEFEEALEGLEAIKFNYEDYAISDDLDKLKESIRDEIKYVSAPPRLEEEEVVADVLEPEVEPELEVEPEPEVHIIDEVLVEQEPRGGYLARFDAIEIRIMELDNDPTVGSQIVNLSYDLWDDLLNELWGELKNNLPDHVMSELLAEQRQWIKNKEAEHKQLYEDGHTNYVAGQYLADVTEARCRELVARYMD